MQSLFCREVVACGAVKHPAKQVQVNLLTAMYVPCKNHHCLCLLLKPEDAIWLFEGWSL